MSQTPSEGNTVFDNDASRNPSRLNDIDRQEILENNKSGARESKIDYYQLVT